MKKMLQSLQRKFVVFMITVSLLTIKSKTGFQFGSGDMLLRDELGPKCPADHNQNALRELMECNPHKSIKESVLDLSKSQSTICYHLKKIGNVSMKIF